MFIEEKIGEGKVTMVAVPEGGHRVGTANLLRRKWLAGVMSGNISIVDI